MRGADGRDEVDVGGMGGSLHPWMLLHGVEQQGL